MASKKSKNERNPKMEPASREVINSMWPRLIESATIPPISVTAIVGTERQKPRSPRCVAEPLSSNTSQGIAKR